ncbi:MAG: tRNA (adenosine(37)-N6)-threonylcarbamoyltransferase complex ATPase subunit type 1 TsaE [Clostridiales bacterium]|nr:tRNA (adenosine(37)-N6)-threonylcarbamoyltransferase complex ATPase subunit type 1 TsaE [Clostridiales bacterium]
MEIARRFAAGLEPGAVIALYGGLGAGKTAFVTGLAQGMGIDAPVSSPTFALVHEYSGGRGKLCHFDMYRIDGWEDLESTGFFDYLDMGATLAVEWSENIHGALPEDCWEVEITPLADGTRRIRIGKRGE